MEIRKLATPEEYLEAENVQRVVWHFPDREIIPLNELVVMQKNGGHVFGAFDGPKMTSFCFGVPGYKEGKVFHYSRMLGVMLRRRMGQEGMDTHGAQPWAFMIVGGVQLATHSWMSSPRMSSDALIDYLTMLSWNALCGIVEVGGSLDKFREQPHPSPLLP